MTTARLPQLGNGSSAAAETGGSAGLTALIRRLQDGDQTALEPFIQQTQSMAWRLASSLVSDTHLCEDILQDVYFTVYREIRHLREPAAFRTWFARILTNRCRRVMRKPQAVSLQAMAETGREPAEAGHEERATLHTALRETLSTLGTQDRTVLILREVMQLSYTEIAEALKMQLGTVKWRLSEARRRLLARWGE